MVARVRSWLRVSGLVPYTTLGSESANVGAFWEDQSEVEAWTPRGADS